MIKTGNNKATKHEDKKAIKSRTKKTKKRRDLNLNTYEIDPVHVRFMKEHVPDLDETRDEFERNTCWRKSSGGEKKANVLSKKAKTNTEYARSEWRAI